jgi:hypothetical protein
LDYSYADGEQANIAMIRVPAALGNSSYKGPLLMNPGGSGGNGIEFILEFGPEISSVIGPQFDILSFDPRGSIFFTTSPPYADAFV